jgi:hypothetical protein
VKDKEAEARKRKASESPAYRGGNVDHRHQQARGERQRMRRVVEERVNPVEEVPADWRGSDERRRDGEERSINHCDDRNLGAAKPSDEAIFDKDKSGGGGRGHDVRRGNPVEGELRHGRPAPAQDLNGERGKDDRGEEDGGIQIAAPARNAFIYIIIARHISAAQGRPQAQFLSDLSDSSDLSDRSDLRRGASGTVI